MATVAPFSWLFVGGMGMSGRVKVPINVIRSGAPKENASAPSENAPVADAAPPVTEASVTERPSLPPDQDDGKEAVSVKEDVTFEEELEKWRDRALRLEAEMDNFRKRQRKLAESQMAADRELLMRGFLNVIDDMSRALSAEAADVQSLRQGVDMTYQSMLRLLDQQGVELLDAKGRPFDPTWHEAVGSVPYQDVGVEKDTVVEVVQQGYRLGDQLLRPARVIVAM